MKEIKQKPAGGKPKTADAARVPKAVVKAAWLQAREAARAGEKQVVGGKDGAYSGAADTGEKGADKLVSTGERVTELAYRGGRKLAERSAGQRRERAKAAQTGGEAAQRHGAGETIAHTSTIEASRPPQTREAGRVSDENRPAGARPQQRESRAVGRAKPIKPGREMKQGAPGPKTTEQAGKARQAVQAAARNGQAKARFTQRAQQTAKRAVDTTKRATDAARAGMRALVEALHSLLIALAAGGSVAVLIVVLICLIAFVAGSAYGIFFAAEAPGEDAFTVQQAVEQLGGEYRDYLQQIESTMPHDRQEIKANDDVIMPLAWYVNQKKEPHPYYTENGYTIPSTAETEGSATEPAQTTPATKPAPTGSAAPTTASTKSAPTKPAPTTTPKPTPPETTTQPSQTQQTDPPAPPVTQPPATDPPETQPQETEATQAQETEPTQPDPVAENAGNPEEQGTESE